jgi:hypothetical protein
MILRQGRTAQQAAEKLLAGIRLQVGTDPDNGAMMGNHMKARDRSTKWPVTTGVEEAVRFIHFCVEPKLSSVCAFLCGYDAAFGGAALLGLHQWLVLKKIKGDGNAHWTQNLTRLAHSVAGRSASEAVLVDTARVLLKQFFAYRRRHGITKICAEYVEWRRRGLRQKAATAARSSPSRP